ncbi:hypothetical protein CI15_33330 [Paraburkholderia monticola]|uniref:Uncharacterized protein n=1 Tax=Paraburkholderia monticola TaxID=1399968 RepID=A0A149PBM5_9BURK|nr:hypothetical protein [Paraburkholderia monticola]KXU82420.1 hypothetical protein CI15_33330 [Paraburkholderia monticola]
MRTFARDMIFRGTSPGAASLRKQSIYVIDRTKPPGCFINHDVGSRETPLPANSMLDERYGVALRNLLNRARNEELFRHIFHDAKDDHPDAAHGMSGTAHA